MSLLKNPCHPGEVIKELYLKLARMNAIELTRCLKVSWSRIERTVRQETVLSVYTAMHLAKF